MTRSAGILLHVSSLPDSPGTGDLGPAATRFCRWLGESGATYWQVLPLNPVTTGGSPYDALSAFAGNTHLISPEVLIAEGLLPAGWLDGNPPPKSDAGIDFPAIDAWKQRMVRDSWTAVVTQGGEHWVRQAQTWSAEPEQRGWLKNWTLFAALREKFGGVSWQEWDPAAKARHSETLDSLSAELSSETDIHRWGQWLFHRQWHNVREFAQRKGVRVIGDVPIYVALDSADVWANPHLFKLDENLAPTVVSGVPPDYFAPEGQRWGNPIYRWDVHRESGYEWWIERLRRNAHMFDAVRLDHFRGFAGYWEIPTGEPTAVKGSWQPGPGLSLFKAIHAELGSLPLIAEDLGIITDDVIQLRDELGLPGMRVLQFGFGEQNSMHLPHNYPEHSVAYTGTHDNDTLRGWFDAATTLPRAHAIEYLGTSNVRHAVGRGVEAVLRSPASLAIVPLQDLLGLGGEARLNTPGTIDSNWRWRAPADYDEKVSASGLRALLEQTDRI